MDVVQFLERDAYYVEGSAMGKKPANERYELNMSAHIKEALV